MAIPELIGTIWRAAMSAAPLRFWALIAAGPALTAGAASLVLIVWSDGWPVELRAKQLDFLGWSLILTIALIGIIVVTLAAVRAKMSGPGGTSFEVDGSYREQGQ